MHIHLNDVHTTCILFSAALVSAENILRRSVFARAIWKLHMNKMPSSIISGETNKTSGFPMQMKMYIICKTQLT